MALNSLAAENISVRSTSFSAEDCYDPGPASTTSLSTLKSFQTSTCVRRNRCVGKKADIELNVRMIFFY